MRRECYWMISKYVKEQKRYTQDELRKIFECTADETVQIIRKLKEYGIVKNVKKSDRQSMLSDLVEEDIRVTDIESGERELYYVFSFVGVIVVYGRVLKCYPKYINSCGSPIAQMKQIMRVLEKYNSKEQVIKLYNESDDGGSFNLLAVMLYLLQDYYDNGILADKRRPAVIVSNHGINEKAPFVKVVYLTTAPKSNHPAHVKVQCGKPGTALCEKSQTISKSFLENYIGTLTEEEMFQIDRGIQIGYGIKNNVYDYDNEEDSFVKDIANYIQEMDHLLSKLCDLKELDQKARHIDIEQLLGKDVIALGRILPDSGLEAVRAAMVSQADKEQKKIREKLELMIGKR